MILDELAKIEHVILDVDGVLTDGSVIATDSDEMWRSFNIKDGYALQYAVKQGLNIVIISGGNSQGVRNRLQNLGINYVYTGVSDKLSHFKQLVTQGIIDPKKSLFMGDDYPDMEVMDECAIKACPADAVWEVKETCHWIAKHAGGKGAVRELLEVILKLQDRWASSEKSVW